MKCKIKFLLYPGCNNGPLERRSAPPELWKTSQNFSLCGPMYENISKLKSWLRTSFASFGRPGF